MEAAAVTEEVSFIAVPAKSPKPSFESPIAPPRVGKIIAASTLKRRLRNLRKFSTSLRMLKIYNQER